MRAGYWLDPYMVISDWKYININIIIFDSKITILKNTAKTIIIIIYFNVYL